MSIYLVIFGKPRYLGFLDMNERSPEKGTHILVESLRGIELGLVAGKLTSEQQDRFRASCAEEPQEGQPKGGEPMLQNVTFVSLPEKQDIKDHEANRLEEQKILIRSREILRSHDLSMKLVDVEYMLDRKKLFFYFTSDQRVDFRAYVRDLAREFKTRIELRQIGVRDEAKTVKGIGPCGQVCCCSYWLHAFTPICIKMVKEQNLALNPTKISGICGRLMCCMSYEHPMYRELWSSLPNPGTKLKTPKGNYIILGVDLNKEAVRVRCPEGPEILVTAQDFSEFRECIMNGKVWEKTIEQEVAVPKIEEIFDFEKTVPISDSADKEPPKRPSGIRKKRPRGPKKKTSSPEKKESGAQPVKEAKGSPKGGAAPKKRRRKKKPKTDQAQKKGESPQTENKPSQKKDKPQGKKRNNSRRSRGARPDQSGKPKRPEKEKRAE